MTNLKIGTILIAKESFGDYTKDKEYSILENDRDVNYKVSSDNSAVINWFSDKAIEKDFTIKRYTLTDLQEKKIAIKLNSKDDYDRLCELLNHLFVQGDYSESEYHGIDEDNEFVWLTEYELKGYIRLESIDEIDLGDEGKETVLIATDADCVERIQQLESEIARLKGELDKSQEAGKCIAEKLADEMKEKVAYMEDINELKDDNKNLLAANLHITEKYNELIKLRESPQISQDLTKRERMAWEIWLQGRYTVEQAIEKVNKFLEESKEVGND